MPKLSDHISRPRRGAALLQVAALPWREGPKGAEVLLVADSAGGGFAIPKGWPKRNRTDAQAAALEADQEAGAIGEIAPQPIGKLFYWKELTAGRVRIEAAVYPLKVQRLRTRRRAGKGADRVWMPAGEAAEVVRDPDLAALIEGL